MNFYYRFQMNAELRLLLAESSEVETAYCKSEGENVISQKLETVFAFADGKHRMWEMLRELEPVKSSFHFWIE